MSNNRKFFIFLLVFIFALGIFLRSYNFSDWLHFELDQSRDARVISSAIEKGPSDLPLLGPRAGGTFLRLGPVFYYFEYVSAVIFGNTPSGMAAANLLFSIGSILVFFIFCREYFSNKIAISLMFIFSVSLFLVMYSRFVWNPNSLIFFELVTFFSLLKTVNREEKRRGVWLLIFSLSLTIATQLHFLALLSLPLISLIFLLIKRPKIPLRFWIVSVSVILLFYVPVALNEIKTGGDNAEEFVKAISGKSNKEEHSMVNSFIRNYQENSVASWMIISGSEKGESLKIDRTSIKNKSLICGKDCNENLPYTILALTLFSGAVFFLIKKLVFGRNVQNRNFILIISIWFFVSFAAFNLLAFDLSPRFFLLTAPIYLVFFGFWLEALSKIWKGWLIIILSCIFIATNLYFIFVRFSQLKSAHAEDVRIEPDRILKERTRVTLFQEMSISRFIAKESQKNKLPIFIKSDPQYERSFKYLLESDFPVASFKPGGLYAPGNYFLIWRTSSNIVSKNEKYLQFFSLIEEKGFGTLSVFYLSPKKEFLNQYPVERIDAEAEPNNPRRYTWKELFSPNGENNDKTESEEELLIQEDGL
ncbi:MAG: glycosyltransferase family 39 protein [bacterium]|nr:glycosyltransferase family 39 protein [bacterium]